MGRRLKQIKRDDLGESGKGVIDSLIAKPKHAQREEKHEQMRCKVDILEGTVKTKLVDTFTVNTTNIDKTISDIIDKYGANLQFKITNLYDEKVVAKRLLYTGGYDSQKDDKEHFARSMDIIRRIFKLKEEGKTCEETEDKIAYLAARSYIRGIYNSTEEAQKQILRDVYGNQNLGKSSISDILSEDLNTKKDIVSNVVSEFESEQNVSEENDKE